MRPTDFSVLAGIDPARVSRLAKGCRILQNPRSREVVTDHPLTRGYLLSRRAVLRSEMQGFCKPAPGWKLACAVIDQRKRAIVGWPDIPGGGKYAEWFADAELDFKKMTATINGNVFPVTLETGVKK